jgi:hypothetical protein
VASGASMLDPEVAGRVMRHMRDQAAKDDPVKNYVSALFAKLGLERRTQVAAYAARTLADQDRAQRDR